MKERVRNILLEAGAVAVGFAEAGDIDKEVNSLYNKWLLQGNHGSMEYLKRHSDLKKSTESVLKDAKTVISLAFPFIPSVKNLKSPYISAYAFYEDYHLAIRKLLADPLKKLKNEFGGNWRLCIDTAPVAERYWALKSGIGERGLNGMVIVKGYGSFSFLAEILTTVTFPPDKESSGECIKCGKCISECPANALNGDGTMDARKCINYLTIEKKGDLSEAEKEILRKDGGYLFGCDKCLRACSYKMGEKSDNYPLSLNENVGCITPEMILSLNEQEFKDKFFNSPLSYPGLSRLQRNSRIILKLT